MAKENHRGKKYVAAAAGLNRDEVHDLTAAVTKVKSMAKAKFDETIDIAVRLGLDTKKSEQTIRGTVSMPSGTGKAVRVAVFAQGDNAKAAREAGADIVGADDLAADIEKGNMNFD
ncbi:MAG: 50S ribosomal protein L1, partial [Actinomycetota bacterium]